MAEKTPASDMPRMVPDRDDIRVRTTRSQVERKPKKVEHPAPASNQGQSWVMVTLLLIAGVSIGYLALQQYSMAKLIESYDERMYLADERIVRLEQALTQTDESVAMNGTAINAQFKAIKTEADLHMSEIRKLWDVTNKRNRLWIEANQVTLAAHDKSLKTVKDSITAINKGVVAIEAGQVSGESRLVALTEQLSGQKNELLVITSNLTDESEKIGTATRAIESLMNNSYDDQFLTLTLTQENLLGEQSKFAATQKSNADQVSDIVESITAIDASRLATSQRLGALMNQIESLEARVTSLAGSPE